ncbi:MAG: uracil-DNA glycosylase family protein [Hyphomicrobiales bacterium]|nr:uracil-DNA glycosylase family protein [Hyphomicrobiales bacterium]
MTADEHPATGDDALDRLVHEIRACRICLERPLKRPLPHEPRPVLRVSSKARIAICGQAPGTRVHASGTPFSDPSGDRLREWLGVTAEEFYDQHRIAIVPMGFCFPGHDAKGGDLPPRRECVQTWHRRLFAALPRFEVIIAVGGYAQAFHLGDRCRPTLTQTVRDWRSLSATAAPPFIYPTPHPSWRNSGWLKANPCFGAELLPQLRRHVRALLDAQPAVPAAASTRGGGNGFAAAADQP